MKHFIKKNQLTICGAGGGGGGAGGGGSIPVPPPTVSQYPSVLAPPQMGNINSIASFSYAEIIDLISDGPIEGLINKNGKKVYDENIFEGIYLNDSPIKETSSTKTQKISIDFLKKALLSFWSDNKNTFATKVKNKTSDTLSLEEDKVKYISRKLESGSASLNFDDINFESGVQITSYSPEYSVFYFISLLEASFDVKSLIEKNLNLIPISTEKIFLTTVEIPKFKFFLNKTFDTSEGGIEGRFPLKISIPNIGNYIYFSIGSDSLNSFNYFEMPRSYVENKVITSSGQKTFAKTLISSEGFYEYDAYNLRIFIWSIYSEVDGIKDLTKILDKYFNNLIIYQNDSSLFNHNLVQAEFKTGTEIQTPLNTFNDVEIDIDIRKELVGPFKLISCKTKNTTTEDCYWGVGRIQNLNADASSKPDYTNENCESSDDIRYVKSWAVEYTSRGGCPLLICDLHMNYSLYDKTSSSRSSQEAVPITHYIENENVEEIYVTLSLDSLYDTAHVDLVANNSVVFDTALAKTNSVNKYSTTCPALPGTRTWGDIRKTDYGCYDTKTGYFLIVGNSINDGYIIDSSNSLVGITGGIQALLSYGELVRDRSFYYEAIYGECGLCTVIENIEDYSKTDSVVTFEPRYRLDLNSKLICWSIPRSTCFVKESIRVNNYIGNPDAFEAKIKQKDLDGSYSYPYGLSDREVLYKDPVTKNFLTCVAYTNPIFGSCLNSSTSNLFVAQYKYLTLPNSFRKKRATVGVILNAYIDYADIFPAWNRMTIPYFIKGLSTDVNSGDYRRYARFFGGGVPVGAEETIPNLKTLYPNIQKFIVDRFFSYWESQKLRYPLLAYTRSDYDSYDIYKFWQRTTPFYDAIGDFILVGYSVEELLSQEDWFSAYFSFTDITTSRPKLKLSVLDQLLEDKVLKTSSNATRIAYDKNITDLSWTSALERNLKQYENGKLIGYSSISRMLIDTLPWTWPSRSAKYVSTFAADPSSAYYTDDIFTYSTHLTTGPNAPGYERRFYDLNNVFFVNKDPSPKSAYIEPKAKGFAYDAATAMDQPYEIPREDDYFTPDVPFDSTPHSEVIIYYDLFENLTNSIKNQSQNLDLDAPQYIRIERDSAGNDNKCTPADFSKAIQNITAGTRLPAIVKIKVETGYESREKVDYIGESEYFKYIFDIFGMTNQQSFIDLGRKTYDFVYGTKASFDRGGYLTSVTNIYYATNKLYLYKITANLNNTTEFNKFFISDLENINFGDLNFNSFIADESAGIYEIKDSDEKIIGYKQIVDPSFHEFPTEFIQKYYSSIFETSFLKDYSLGTISQASSYFNNNFGIVDLSKTQSCLRKNINGLKIIPDGILNIESYGNSCSEISSNPEVFDTYLICDKNNANKFIKLEKYNYNYGLYQQIPVVSEDKIKEASSFYTGRKYWISFYFEQSVGTLAWGEPLNSSLFESLKKAFPDDVILQFPTLQANPTPSQITAGKSVPWKNSNFIIRLSKSTFNPITSVPDFAVSDPLYNLPYANNLSSLFKPDIREHINAFLNEETLLNKINSKIVGGLPFLKRNVTIGGIPTMIEDSLDFSYLKGTYSTKWVYEHRRSNVSYYSLLQALNMSRTQFLAMSKIGPVKSLAASDAFSIDAIDLRSRASFEIKTVKEPTFFKGDFVVIRNNYNKSLSIIINNYGMYSSALYGINLYDYIEQTSFRNQYFEFDPNVGLGAASVENSAFRLWVEEPWVNMSLDVSPANLVGQAILNKVDDYGSSYIGFTPGILCAGHIWGLQSNRICQYPLFGATFNDDVYPKCSGKPGYQINFHSQQRLVYSLYATTKDKRILQSNWYLLPNSTLIYYVAVYKHAQYYYPNYQTNGLAGQLAYSNGSTTTLSGFRFIAGWKFKFVNYWAFGYSLFTSFDYKYHLWSRWWSTVVYVFNPTFKKDAVVGGNRIVTTKVDLPLSTIANSNILNYAEDILKQKGIIKSDMKIMNKILSPKKTWTAEGSRENQLDIFYYSDVPFSNIESDYKKTYASDSGLAIQIPAPKYYADGTPFKRYVKITKLSYETLSPLISKRVSVAKITEVIPQKFSYPFSSIVGIKIDSRAFSNIPTRTYLCKLKKVLVPSNYFPDNEDGEDVRYIDGRGIYKIYDGDWDGTFKLMWTNNPAWVLMDMLVNKRYGLGNYVSSDQIDIWELYKIARWCDGVDDNGYYYGVPDSYGGTEPRHAFNGLVTEKFNVFDMLNQIASIFRGHVYYMNSMITFDDDRLKPIIGEFNNSDVKDGIFNYTNHKKDDEYTAVEVAYRDEKDNYKPKIEYVEDSDGIRKRGILKKQINAFGVTSRGQARRLGLHFLFQTSKENSNVSFSTDMKALLYKPGDLIGINDELFTSYKNYGKVQKIENLDAYRFKITVSPYICEEFLETNEITLYTPIAKPKYEDILSSVESYPYKLCISTRNIITKRFDNSYDNRDYVFCKSEEKDLITDSYYYTGKIIYNYSSLIQCTLNSCLKYIKNYDINNNFSEKYGHWRLTTGFSSEDLNQDLYLFDSSLSLIEKNTNPKKQYFFTNLDSGIYLRYTGADLLDLPLYESKGFSLTGNLNEPFKICVDLSVGYSSGTISYAEIIENDKPSIENFRILTGDHYINENYSELEIFKSGWDKNGIYTKIKESVKNGIENLVTGSFFSLKIKNLNQPTFKVMSITENYINEYSILATEYNTQKFTLIEDNSSIDDLNNTFNFNSAYNSKNNKSTRESLLKAPIFKSLFYVKDEKFNKKYLNIRWSPSNIDSDLNSSLYYQIFIQSPSKQTNNFSIKNIGQESYKKETNEYEVNFDLEQANFEIGTYIVSINTSTMAYAISAGTFISLEEFSDGNSSMSRISSAVSKSILILEN